jgi:hypothetical protein
MFHNFLLIEYVLRGHWQEAIRWFRILLYVSNDNSIKNITSPYLVYPFNKCSSDVNSLALVMNGNSLFNFSCLSLQASRFNGKSVFNYKLTTSPSPLIDSSTGSIAFTSTPVSWFYYIIYYIIWYWFIPNDNRFSSLVGLFLFWRYSSGVIMGFI